MELTAIFDLAFFVLAGGVLGYLVFKWADNLKYKSSVFPAFIAISISVVGVLFLGMSVAFMNPLAYIWVSRVAVAGGAFFITWLVCVITY